MSGGQDNRTPLDGIRRCWFHRWTKWRDTEAKYLKPDGTTVDYIAQTKDCVRCGLSKMRNF